LSSPQWWIGSTPVEEQATHQLPREFEGQSAKWCGTQIHIASAALIENKLSFKGVSA
jgi:hypothetical protein